ncbi:MAG TPA: c-type cytochrome [Gemmatales bacterium]|nr:c-type cytochrome [Gemmatales bacterium]
MRVTSLLILLILIVCSYADDPPVTAKPKADQRQQLSARDEQGTFQLDPNFTIELAAAEPDIVDPVCFCFDARGDLYVVEMRGYPNGGKGEGKPNLAGRVRKLQDLDGDGYYETSTIFVDQLRFPCGITPWRDGFLIGDAPDLLFVADRSGQGKADVRQVLYTGFGNSNIQQMINALQYHHDGWIYGCNGGNDSPVRSVEKPDSPIVQLRGMHFRIKPDVPGSIEPTSGGGQYGLAVTECGQWLTCTNSQHLRHIVLPNHYLKRNPSLAVPAVTLDIPDHGAAARVYRISPFEAWRVERTTRRAGSEEANRFPSTELVPGGYITSASGLALYNGGTYPNRYHNNVFVCDPANNLVHRDVLVPSGSTYRAERHDKDCEFLASTDTWFRPVFLANGPDGSMYVADFYREIIETPLSLPDDIKAKWNLNSRERGRIWRIKPKKPEFSLKKSKKLSDCSSSEQVAELGSPIGWRRETALRLLAERRPMELEVIASLRGFLYRKPAFASLAAMSLLHQWQKLKEDDLSGGLKANDQEGVPVRITSLQLLEKAPSLSRNTRKAIERLIFDDHPHVQFQLALSLGSLALSTEEKLFIAGSLLERPDLDTWMETAILSSIRGLELDLLKTSTLKITKKNNALERLAQLTRKNTGLEQLTQDKVLHAQIDKKLNEHTLSMLRGLGPEYARTFPNLTASLIAMIHQADVNPECKELAISVLSFSPWKETEATFRELLSLQSPLIVQQQALLAMKAYSDPEVANLLLSLWKGWSPNLRREAQEILLSRAAFINRLLEHVEAGTFAWQQIDLARRELLMRSRHADFKARATALQARLGVSNRSQVLSKYEPALKLDGNAERGKSLFTKTCASCHQLQGQGHIVGPDLLGALGNKTTQAIFVDILDPNREVDPRYVNYVVVTKTGRTLTGIISSESSSSITFKRAEGIEETVLRTDIDEMQGTGKSLMPENLEEQLSPQELADVMSYLLSLRPKK